MENDREDLPERVRLPRYDEAAAAAYWRAAGGWTPADMRDLSARRTRRASNWTAAALVAGVAVTTGYLAHSTAPTATTPAHKHRARAQARPARQQGPAAPAYAPPPVQAPVVTSGGSGGRSAGGGGD